MVILVVSILYTSDWPLHFRLASTPQPGKLFCRWLVHVWRIDEMSWRRRSLQEEMVDGEIRTSSDHP